MLVIDSPRFAAQLTHVMDGLIAQSSLVSGGHDYQGDAPISKLGAMFAANLLLRPFQDLL